MLKRCSDIVKHFKVFLDHKFPHLVWICLDKLQNTDWNVERETNMSFGALESQKFLELELLD